MEKFNLNDISLVSTSKKAEFCKIWPTVKQGLELLKAMITNPMAKGAITLVITAGDTICGN